MAVARRQRGQRPAQQPEQEPEQEQPGQEQPGQEQETAELPALEAPEAETAAGTEQAGTEQAAPEAPVEAPSDTPPEASPPTGQRVLVELNADGMECLLVGLLTSWRDKQGKEDSAAWIAAGLAERELYRTYNPPKLPRHAAPVEPTAREEPEWALPDRREAPPVPV